MPPCVARDARVNDTAGEHRALSNLEVGTQRATNTEVAILEYLFSLRHNQNGD
jgi:hypothetical protein